nr:helix-turn-helix transcriptional regulator [Verticiella sp. GG226]
MEPWSAATLARAAGVSEKDLRRGIRLATGTTIHSHVRELRLQAGARQLAEGIPVTQVALDVGYASLSHFSKAFRARFGVMPRVWRRGP